MTSIRRLEPEDAPILWELLYHALHVPPHQPPFPRAIVHEPDLRRYAEDWGRPTDLGLLASGVDGAIGGAWLRLFSASEPGFGFVDEHTPELSIAVLPGHRGQGIGTMLMQRLLAEAKERFPAISLSVSTTNPAVRLYERLGFVPIAQQGASVTMLYRWESALTFPGHD